jgi:hypothetical protein
MTLIERLTMKLTEEQREEFFDLVDEHPDVSVMDLYHRVLRQPKDIEE